MKAQPSLLTIAGFDPTGGAGLMQDVAAFKAYGWHGLAVPTVAVAEDSQRVLARYVTTPAALRLMCEALRQDFHIRGIKLGLLPSRENCLDLIGDFLKRLRFTQHVPVVFDPVLSNSRGDKLFHLELLPAVRELILPHVDLITPNFQEFLQWTGGKNLRALSDIEKAAQQFFAQHGVAVLITGMHLDDEIGDLLVDGEGVHLYLHPRLHGDAHGTGCLYSCLLLMALAADKSREEAVTWAQQEMQKHLSNPRYPARSHRPFLPVGVL